MALVSVFFVDMNKNVLNIFTTIPFLNWKNATACPVDFSPGPA